MKQRRMKVPPERGTGYYHCVSRIVDRRFIFRAREKEHFVALLRECEAFCEVQVLTYCLMSNHFHVLVEVPPRPKELPSAQTIVAKLRRLSGYQDVGKVEQRLAMFRKAQDPQQEQEYLETFYARMWDVSAFMKLLKQRFTQWYNGRNGRRGTLWEERFRSVVVEGLGPALGAMAAYIDLNPVRAGMVKDPKDYRWSGYGEAVAGKRRAREGIGRVVRGILRGKEESLGRAMEVYREHVYNEGREDVESVGEDGKPVRGVLKHEEVVKVLRRRGRLGLGDYVRCRVRYFCDGAVMGSREFVEEMFGVYRERFGVKRRDGARRMQGLAEGEELFTVRDLRVKVFG